MKLKLLIGLGVGGLCLWLALRKVDWVEVKASLTGLSYLPLFGALLLMPATHILRAFRIRRMLLPVERIGLKELFSINSVGFLSIHILPLRLGELTRPLLLKKRHGIPMSTGLATIGLERVLDGIVVALILMIGLLSVPVATGGETLLPFGVVEMAWGCMVVFVGALSFLFLSVVFRSQAIRLVNWVLRLLPIRFRERLGEMFENFLEGLRSLPNFASFSWLLGESLAVWGVVVVAYWLVFQSFGFDLAWGAAFTVLGVAAVGVMIPGPPGFVGTFQLFVQAGLLLYGISRSTGFAYSMVVYTMNILYVMLAGTIFMPRMATKVRALVAEVGRTAEQT